jgi:YfiR/HmsC-like
LSKTVTAATLIAWLFLSDAIFAPAKASEIVAPDRQALILTRALAYDGNLKARAGSELVVAVLAKGAASAADPTAEGLTKALKALGPIKVQGLPLRALRLGFTNAASLSTAIENQGIDAIYLCPGLEAELGPILEVTKEHKVLSMGSREDHVVKGASLGVFLVDGKPTIYVNLTASKAEGTAFGSDLLRVAKVLH